jgi:hypothetical protein
MSVCVSVISRRKSTTSSNCDPLAAVCNAVSPKSSWQFGSAPWRIRSLASAHCRDNAAKCRFELWRPLRYDCCYLPSYSDITSLGDQYASQSVLMPFDSQAQWSMPFKVKLVSQSRSYFKQTQQSPYFIMYHCQVNRVLIVLVDCAPIELWFSFYANDVRGFGSSWWLLHTLVNKTVLFKFDRTAFHKQPKVLGIGWIE